MTDVVRILVIDDSEDDRMLYKRHLQKSAETRFVVTEAASGEEGLALMDEAPFACVLLDYSLPGRDGIEVLKRIRAKHPYVAVVMLTGLGNEKVAVAAMREGAQNYISKAAIDPHTLAHVVQIAFQQCGMWRRIAEQGESIDVFARALAHDLKEPVRTMRTLLDLMNAAAPFEGKIDDHFQSLRYAAERMTGLIDSVYFYTQLDSSRKAKPEDCDANDLVEAAKQNIVHLIDRRRAVITCAPLPRVSINREQGVQVFQNLLSNAIQNCATTPRVEISAEPAGDHWRFRVSDNGPGIGEPDIENLFKPFKRLSRHEMQGPGLGLATNRKILELHGGRIWLERGTGKGAVFIFSVPKVKSPIATVFPEISSPPAKTLSIETGGRIANVLMVDDDDMAIDLARIMLIDGNHLQCGVLVARDGEEALARLRESDIDLVLLDINMPRMDGFELLERIRDERRLDRVAVVMCSSSSYHEDVVKAKSLGARGYMTKPPDIDRLRAILAASTTLEIVPGRGKSRLLLQNS